MIKAKIDKNGIVSNFIEYEKVINDLKKEFEFNCIQNNVEDKVINLILEKNDKKRKNEDLRKIIIRKKLEDTYKKKKETYDEQYVEFIPSNPPVEAGELDDISTYYEKGEDGKIYQCWNVNKNHPGKVKIKIKELKDSLSKTDYLIIKTYEAKISMSDAPYSQEYLDEIIQERQALRDRINELEELIK